LTTQVATKLQCPECPAQYNDARGLATHRRYKHGTIGTSAAAVSMRNKQKAHGRRVHKRLKGSFPCTVEGCSFIAQWQGGLTTHMHAHTRRDELAIQSRTEIAGNGAGVQDSNQEAHFAANSIAEIPLAIALGRFQELCRSLAFEHNIPERLFAQRLAELVYRAQVR
jgi:hypothetical protein